MRASPRSRYRQWMTHKLATWIDQFGTSGCVGCGRCITWCPVGIDITEEVAAIRATDGAAGMSVTSIDELIAERAGLCGPGRGAPRADGRLRARTGCFAAGEYLFREGEQADALLRDPPRRRGARAARSAARRARDRDAARRRPARLVLAVPALPGEFDGRAREDRPGSRFDGACLRGKCESDHELGYGLMRRFAQVMVERLQATRLRLLDVYGDGARLTPRAHPSGRWCPRASGSTR